MITWVLTNSLSQEKITAISGAIFGVAAFIAGFPGVLPEDTPRLPFLIITITLATLSFVLILISFFDLRYAIHNLYNLKKLGIAVVHPQGVSGNEAKRSNLSKAKKIKFIAVSGEGFVKVFKKEIIHSLIKQKAIIQVLLATPNSEFINDSELNESESRVGHISPEIKKTIAMLQEYLKMAKDIEGIGGAVGRIYIGHYNTNLRSSILICDNDFGWLTLNLPPTRAVESPSFELKKTEDGLLSIANDHFERIWTICQINNSIIEIT